MSSTNLIYFSCSFDDGDVADMRLADLMKQYNISGTFYIPKNCNLVKKSLNDNQIKMLSSNFEIGGHTIHHSVLTNINNNTSQAEISDCKKWLEDVTGKNVNAFCPPRGKFNAEHVSMIANAGYDILRTVEMLQTKKIKHDRNTALTILPTTTQVFNHSMSAYIKNATKRLNINLLIECIKTYNSSWKKMATNQLQKLMHTENTFRYFHLWGHSWEIEKYNLWNETEDFFKKISSTENIISCTNSELVFAIKNYKTH